MGHLWIYSKIGSLSLLLKFSPSYLESAKESATYTPKKLFIGI